MADRGSLIRVDESELVRILERNRQAAFLYSVVQSAEELEETAKTALEHAYDLGIIYAASLLLSGESGSTDWPTEVPEYADEIRDRLARAPVVQEISADHSRPGPSQAGDDRFQLPPGQA